MQQPGAVAAPSPSPGTLLAGPLGDRLVLGPELWGFGGLHGGLALALLTSAMQERAQAGALRSVTAQYHRPIRGEFRIEIETSRSGRTVTAHTARAVTSTGANVTASAIFGASGRAASNSVRPEAPPAPPPLECPVFTIPPEFVPFARHTEIRPVGPNRPYTGGTEPELTAWIRLVDDDAPPDPHRLVVLMDALAPSYTAVMTTPDMVPTVELTVRPTEALGGATSPWILLRARTRVASVDGWIDEQLDAWGPDGRHVGSGQQLRLVVADR